MLASNTAGTSTASANATTLISNPKGYKIGNLVLVNGANPGFFSIDAGTTWGRLPANATLGPLTGLNGAGDVLIKRDGVTDLTGVFGFAW